MFSLAQVAAPNFWSDPNGSTSLWVKIAIALIVMCALIFGLTQLPPQARRPIVTFLTFISGLYYVLFWAFPSPIARQPDDAPRNAMESFSFWLSDSQSVITNFSNVIAAFMIGLGIFSLLKIHIRKFAKQQKDWFFSMVLLISLIAMVIFGYWDWAQRQTPEGAQLALGVGWGFPQRGFDLLFDGLFQQMEAAMFSMVAFYILSAAYRAFRARSTEASILLATALIVMLSNLGVITLLWDKGPLVTSGGSNFKLTEIALWISSNLQVPAIRGIDFGVGVGLLAMGVRLWLSLEKTGSEG